MKPAARLICTGIRLMGALPVRTRAALGAVVGWLVSHIVGRERRIAELQLRALFGSSDYVRLARSVFASLGESIFESLNVKPYLKKPEQHFTILGAELIDQARSQQRPFVALTAHTGNWDLMAAYMVHLGVPLSTAARRARNPVLQDVLAWLRDRYGVKTIWRGRGIGAKALVTELEQRRTVAALIDQDTRVSSVFAPFFGRDARTPSGLIALGRKYNAVIVSALNYRISRGKYVIEIEAFPSGMGIEEIVHEFNRRLEKVVNKHPEQWVWFHKRWRSSPTEGTLNTAEYLNQLAIPESKAR